MKEEEDQYYDQQFATSPTYKGPAEEHPLFAMGVWPAALGVILPRSGHLIDLGCGTGQFLELLERRGHARLRLEGVDFSREALRQARKRLTRSQVRLADLRTARLEADIMTAFEVLEHVEDDLGILERCRAKLYVCSVPSFWSVGHVRRFTTKYDVEARYAPLFDRITVQSYAFGGSRIHLFTGERNET